jgi:sialidase-1
MNMNIKRHCIFLAAIFTFAAASCSRVCKEEVNRTTLFQSTVQDSIPYRIPSIGQFPDGSILALSDYRPCHMDIGFGRVDMHGRLSKDGKEWGEEFILMEGTGVPHTIDCGFGDAAMVIDRESGEVMIIMVCGNTIYYEQSTDRQNPNRIACLRSHDGGKTWEPWEEITEDIYSLFDECSYGCVQSCFFSSGKIIQSRSVKVGSHYRIYHALAARPNGNRVIYSDDFGHTWSALGGKDALPVPRGDEAKCEELPDGSIVISSRTMGGRYFNVFRFTDKAKGTGNWDMPAYSGPENNGCVALENACNGEILMVPAKNKETGKKVTLALQSIPLGPDRQAVGIYYKEVDGTETSAELAADWEGPYRVSEKPSAYSTMIQLKNRKIAFYFEEYDRIRTLDYHMVYTELSLSEITSGKYVARK